jgi:hypothetical protein
MKEIIKTLKVLFWLGLASAGTSKAETLSIFKGSFNVSGVPAGATGGILSARWGTWDSGSSTFTQQITTSNNAGYVDLSASPGELSVTLNQTLNNVYSPGSLLALAIFTNGSADAQNINFSGSLVRAILTDSSWSAPSFNNSPSFINWSFSANTQAVVGSFSWGGGGTDTVTLVPEPSTGALMMIGAAGLVALRRLRKV